MVWPDLRLHRPPYFRTQLIRTRAYVMTKELIERSRKRHEIADVALLVTTVTLVVSLVIAFTAVSIGIARADTLIPFAGSGSVRLALSIPLGLLIAGFGGLTAGLLHSDKFPPAHD
jgi:hypothetical protein